MKKHLITLFAILIVATSFAQVKKAAIISVFGSRNLSDNPLDTKIYEELMKDSSFNLTPIVNEFDVVVRETFIPDFPFPFLDKKDVVSKPEYPKLAEKTKWADENWMTTAAEEYVPIAAYGIADDEEAIKEAFTFLDVDAVMIVYINFNIYDAVGIGPLTKKKIYANVNMKMFDKDGKRIFKLKDRATSNKGVAAVAGIVASPEKIMPLIQEASDNLLEDMKKKLPKNTGKIIF
jgi:hypothetical protein